MNEDILQNPAAIQAYRAAHGAVLPDEPQIICGIINTSDGWRQFEPYRLLPSGDVEALT